MKNIDKIIKYKDIKNYYNLKQQLRQLLKTIYENNIDYKHIILLIDEIETHINILENIINKNKEKYKLAKIKLSIDDMLKLTEYK